MAQVPSLFVGGVGVHVVHVITRFLQAGSEENTIATCLHQAAGGHRVTLVHGREFDPGCQRRLGNQVEIIRLDSLVHPVRIGADITAAIQLYRHFRRLRPDIVHTHQSKAGILGRVAAAAARVKGIVHTIHIAPFDNVTGWRKYFYLAGERFCVPLTDLFIPVSAGMRDVFLAQKIGTRSNYEVIHSGMDLQRFSASAGPREWRSRIGGWHSKKRPRIILMLAAFEPRKRQLELLRAVAPELSRHRDTCLVLAGKGPLLDLCQEEARALRISDQVRFLGHDPAPEELIALADLCILTSLREGLPRVLVQYIAGGKPVLLSPLAGIDEVVRPGANALISSSSDIDQFVRDMFAVLDDRGKLAALAAGARGTDVSRWTEERMGNLIESAYSRILQRVPQRAA